MPEGRGFTVCFDKEAIREVRYLWAEGLDHQNWALIKSLMVEQIDADFSVSGVPAQRVPSDMLMQSFQHNLSRPGLKTQHIFSNFRITVNGDQATCTSYQLAQHYIQGFAGGEEFHLRAEYEDQLTRTAAGWKISAMKLVAIFYVSGNPGILAG